MKQSWFYYSLSSFLVTTAIVLQSNTMAVYADQQAIFDLVVNLVSQGEVPVLLRDQDVLVRVADLQRVGLQSLDSKGQQETFKGERYVSLSSLSAAIRYQLNTDKFVLDLTVQPDSLPPTLRDLRPNLRPPELRYIQDTSFFLNYAVGTENFRQVSASAEMGLSMGNTLLYSNINLTPSGKLVRGLTNLTIDSPQSQTRWVIGDRFATTGDLGGGALIGGISYGYEASLDPYVVRSPTSNLTGTVLTPSTADIYVNNQLVRREQLPPGQFELQNLPISTGSSETRVVLRDAFGREQQYNYSNYIPARFLPPGQSEFSYSLGFQRLNLSTDNWNYGQLMFLGQHRFGLSDTFTLGLRLEASSNLVSGGFSLGTRLPFGELGLNVAASSAEGLSGSAATLSFATSGKTASFNTTVRWLSPNYSSIGLRPMDDRAELEVGVGASVSLSPQISLFGRYTSANWRDKGTVEQYTLGSTMNLSSQLSLTLSASQLNQASSTSSTNLLLTVNYLFGGGTTASVTQQLQGDRGTTTAQLQKPITTATGLGYRIQTQLSDQRTNILTQLQYKAPFGLYELNLDRFNQQDAVRLNASGSVVFMNGQVFFSQPIQGSFAVIEVPGVAGVRGYLNNQEIGATDDRGTLFLPNLQAYYGNRVSITPDELPLDYSIGATEQVVAPPYRGGAVVRFTAERTQVLMGIVQLQKAGQPVIPRFGQLSVQYQNQSRESPIGNQGEFYLENLAAGTYTAELEYGGDICRFDLTVPATTEPITRLGTLTCTLPTSPKPSSDP